MLRPKPSIIPVLRNLTIALVSLLALSTIVLPLAGCSDNGQGGPSISSLSTPTDNQPSENTEADTTSTETAANEQDDPTISMESTEIEPLPDEAAEASLEPPPPTGATAQMNWDASSDPNVQGYFIHYGKRSSGEHGSCSYEESQRVGPPPATITGLEPHTAYFFAISAFGESESEAETPCSNEIVVVTSAAQG
ncbi:MAG: fibronectin type III domain-containing protein [Nitrospira sp.]|jgi:Fibronectin type III domain|nr:MAG: fibronectin type III domain-containing protein [Nitrospira sp.]